MKASHRMEDLRDSDSTNAFIISVIGVASVLVGVQTYDGMEDNPVVIALDLVILGIFTLEIMMKIVAEGMRPYRYFTGAEWGWNNFECARAAMLSRSADLRARSATTPTNPPTRPVSLLS